MSVFEFVGFVVVSLLVSMIAGIMGYACAGYPNGGFISAFFWVFSAGGFSLAGWAMLNPKRIMDGEY